MHYPLRNSEGEISFLLTTQASDGGTSLRTCTRTATVAKWYEDHAVTRFSLAAKSSTSDKATRHGTDPIDLTRPTNRKMEGPKTAHEEAVLMRKLYQEIVLRSRSISRKRTSRFKLKGLSRKKRRLPNLHWFSLLAPGSQENPANDVVRGVHCVKTVKRLLPQALLRAYLTVGVCGVLNSWATKEIST